MKRAVVAILAGTSLLLCLAAAVMAWRVRVMRESAQWSYFRYRADKSVDSNQVLLTSADGRLFVDVGWGHVGAYNGRLVWGYHVNAEQSGGRPQWRVNSARLDEGNNQSWPPLPDHAAGMSGVGPVRWQVSTRTKAVNGDDNVWVRIGVSYWALVVLFAVLPAVWGGYGRKRHAAKRRGRCRRCGYDLRATPARCPECGTAAVNA